MTLEEKIKKLNNMKIKLKFIKNLSKEHKLKFKQKYYIYKHFDRLLQAIYFNECRYILYFFEFLYGLKSINIKILFDILNEENIIVRKTMITDLFRI